MYNPHIKIHNHDISIIHSSGRIVTDTHNLPTARSEPRTTAKVKMPEPSMENQSVSISIASSEEVEKQKERIGNIRSRIVPIHESIGRFNLAKYEAPNGRFHSPKNHNTFAHNSSKEEKLLIPNLTSSIPSNLLVAKQMEETLSVEERQFKIFPRQVEIKFIIPELSEYYSENSKILPLIDQIEGNEETNGSGESFLNFKIDKGKLARERDMRLDGTLKFGEASLSNNMKFRALKKTQSIELNDEIKETEEENSIYQSMSAKSNKETKIGKRFEFEKNLVFLFAGFMMSVILMVIYKVLM